MKKQLLGSSLLMAGLFMVFVAQAATVDIKVTDYRQSPKGVVKTVSLDVGNSDLTKAPVVKFRQAIGGKLQATPIDVRLYDKNDRQFSTGEFNFYSLKDAAIGGPAREVKFNLEESDDSAQEKPSYNW